MSNSGFTALQINRPFIPVHVFFFAVVFLSPPSPIYLGTYYVSLPVSWPYHQFLQPFFTKINKSDLKDTLQVPIQYQCNFKFCCSSPVFWPSLPPCTLQFITCTSSLIKVALARTCTTRTKRWLSRPCSPSGASFPASFTHRVVLSGS